MVHVFKPLTILLGLLATSTASAAKAPEFQVPSFDYTRLVSGSTPEEVLAALKQDGIISLQQIPGYSSTRAAYLETAAKCAVAADEVNAEFLLRRTFADGTLRSTIRTVAGQELDVTAVNSTIGTHCPDYASVYQEFTSVLERAVSTLAVALDATGFTTTDGDAKTSSNRQLFGDAVRLDHFHAYEVPVSSRRLADNSSSSTVDDLSLPLHEDDGMFIVFPTPSFFSVSSDSSLVQLASDGEADSGLVIETHDHTRVRPVLHENELVVMVGTGFSQWVKASEALPAVMHGMRMPQVTVNSATERRLRAWFGKMTLLPSYQRMLNTDLSFEEHTNMTSRLLAQDAIANNAFSVGCAPGRKLEASATSECTYKSCTMKSSVSSMDESCDVVCNRSHSTDAATCAADCDCTTSSSSATTCWMLCVKNLDSCDTSLQSCSGQSLVCSSTPTPTTATPATTTATPATTTATPTTTTATPTTTTATPSSTTATPTTTTATPTTTTATPSTTTETPSTTTATPSSSTETPSTTTPSPTSAYC